MSRGLRQSIASFGLACAGGTGMGVVEHDMLE